MFFGFLYLLGFLIVYGMSVVCLTSYYFLVINLDIIFMQNYYYFIIFGTFSGQWVYVWSLPSGLGGSP